MKTEFQKIVDELAQYHRTERPLGDARIYTPASFVADVFADDHRGTDVFETLQQICDLDQVTEAEAFIEDALADGDDCSSEFYANCMRLGELLVLAIQDRIQTRLRDKVQAQLEGKL
jgi:hypothetical protein